MDLPWYDDSGPVPGRPVLVLLHAFPLRSAMWDRVLPLLTPHARVLRVDLPGLGRSARHRPAPPTMTAVATSVREVLDDAVVDEAVVWGLSTGGYAALALADLAPDRVAGLILSSTTPWLGAPDVPAERRSVADEIEATGSLDPVADSVDGGLGETAKAEQPALVGIVEGWVRGNDPAGVAWMARAIASREDTSAVLAGFAGPVLLLFGDEDGEVPPGTVQQMASLRPRAEVVVLPATGHLCALERPELAAAAVLAMEYRPLQGSAPPVPQIGDPPAVG